MPSLSALTHRLRVLVRANAEIRYSRHALERMRERDVTHRDVKKILTNGQVRGTDVHVRSGGDLWLVEGFDVDGRRLRAVLDPSDPTAMLVVTVIDTR